MKTLFFLILLLISVRTIAQEISCADKILAKEGSWGKTSRSENAPAAEMIIQRKFVNAVESQLNQQYKPAHVLARFSTWHSRINAREPVTPFGITLYAMQYNCTDGQLKLNHETSTKMTVNFNHFTETQLFDTITDHMLTGFNRLSHGLPVEIQPGIWEFPDNRTALGFGIEGNSKLWLITYTGKLPWSHVTRREFLIRRKKNLQRQMAEETPRYKEQLQQMAMMKKEQEAKNDPAKLQNFINVTYQPTVERIEQNYLKSKAAYEAVIAKIERQLGGDADLDKPAIVIRNVHNHLEYDFTDKVEPFAEVLVKPNPSYFNKALGKSIPQLVTAEIIYDPKDEIANRFMQDANRAKDLALLRSFIGKSNPGPYSAKPAGNISTTSKMPAQNKKPNPAPASKNSTQQENSPASSNTLVNTGKSFSLSGTISAPAGTAVSLRNRNGAELQLISKTPGKQYGTMSFNFPKRIAETDSFDVSFQKFPPSMNAAIYFGKGKAQEAGKLHLALDYRYDLVTRSSDDKTLSSFYEIQSPAIGGMGADEGRYVAFVSYTKNLEGSDGKFRQIFWRDRNTGITKLVSKSANGELANGDCFEPSLSADGKKLVFESKATNLVSGDVNNAKDIFIWHADDHKISLVSTASNGVMADAESFDAGISGNGKFVVFTSSATNLSKTGKGRSNANIFLKDLEAGTTEMISIDPVQNAGGNGHKGSISYDGSRIVFCSATNTLVPDDRNGLWDLFLWERGRKNLKRVSLTHDGKERNAGSESASRQVASAISGDGKWVAFATTASNMVPGDSNKFQDVFVVNVETGEVKVASFTNEGKPSDGDSPIEQGERVTISYDGTWVAFPTKATNLGAPTSNIILHNLFTGKKTAVTTEKGSYTGKPAISYSGSYLLFGKSANLDTRFSASGLFAHFTGNGPCRDCPQPPR